MGRVCRAVNSASLLVVISGIAMVGCTSARLNITTEPAEAEIYARTSDTATEGKLVGKSPLNLESDAAQGVFEKGPVIFEIRKPGFYSTQIYVANLSMGEHKFKLLLKPEKGNEKSSNSNNLIKLVLDAERALIEKRLEEAQRLAVKIREIDANISASYSIEATVFYLQNKLVESKAAWIRSSELDTEDVSAQKMIAEIDKKLGKTSTPEKAK